MEELKAEIYNNEQEIYNNEQEINKLSRNINTNLIEFREKKRNFRGKKMDLEKKNTELKKKICYLKLIDDYGYALINKMKHSYFDTLSIDEQYHAEQYYFNYVNSIDSDSIDSDFIYDGWYNKNTINDINHVLEFTPKIIYEEELLNNVIKSYSIFHSYHPSEIRSEIQTLGRPNAAFNCRIWEIIRSSAGLEGWIKYTNENTNENTDENTDENT